MKRNLKRLGLVLLGLVIVGAVALGITGIVFTNRLNAEIAEIRAKGEPINVEDLAGKRIPDSDNAAPLYRSVQEKVDTDAYDRDFEITEKAISFPAKPLGPAAKERMSQALFHMRPLKDIVEKASRRPECEFDVSASVTGAESTFSEMATLRRIGRLLRASSIYHAQTGSMPGAAEDLVTEFRFIGQLDGRATIMHQLVRVALITIANRTVTDVAQFGDLTEQDARHVYDAMGSIDIAEGFRQAWIGERVSFITTSSPEYMKEMMDSVRSERSFWDMISAPLGFVYEKTLLRGDCAAYLDFISRQLDGVDMDYHQAKAEGLLDESQDLPAYAVIARVLSPVSVRSSFLRFKAEEEVARTRVFLALQAYKARYGGYPASIQELKTKLGWKLPKDPFSEKDLLYVRRNKGFEVYSIGPDMKDDGGRPCPNSGRSPNERGDIVLMWEK